MLRRLDVVTYYIVEQFVEGDFSGGNVELGLAEGAVGLAPFYGLEDMVPQDVLLTLPDVIEGINSGDIQVLPEN